jgi:hypothetical protein
MQACLRAAILAPLPLLLACSRRPRRPAALLRPGLTGGLSGGGRDIKCRGKDYVINFHPTVPCLPFSGLRI